MIFNYDEIWRILLNSFKTAANWALWKWLILGSIGALSSTLQFAEKFFHWDTLRSVKFAGILLVGLFIARFLLIFIKDSLKYYHEVYLNSVYGDAIIILKDSFAYTHFYRKTPGHQDLEFMKSMMLICNNLQNIFQKIIKDDCCVSIKVPISSNKVDEKTALLNLTRDVKHSERDTVNYLNLNHTLIGNTAFTQSFNKVLLNSKQKYYLNNSVNTTDNYDNTSKLCYPDEILPYNSELVYPIIPVISDNKHNSDCRGFICVDSKKINAFSGKYDVAILEAVADGIYDIISQRNQFKNI